LAAFNAIQFVFQQGPHSLNKKQKLLMTWGAALRKFRHYNTCQLKQAYENSLFARKDRAQAGPDRSLLRCTPV
jgi:hypothetical protein